jgi:hypothetical protein
MTQVNKTQIHDESIFDNHVASTAAIQWPKISKVGALASDIGAEFALTFTFPLSRVGNVISVDAGSGFSIPVGVTAGGTGLITIPDNAILFGSPGNSPMGTDPTFNYDDLTQTLSVRRLSVFLQESDSDIGALPQVQIQNNGTGPDLLSYKEMGAVNIGLYSITGIDDINFNTVSKTASIFALESGKITLSNQFSSGLSGLYLGGNTAVDPALIIGSGTVNVKLGDNSDYGTLGTKNVTIHTGGAITFPDASTLDTAAVFTDVKKGLVPPTGGVINKFLASDGTWGSSTGGINGGGTLNYIPKFTAAGDIGDSPLYTNGTAVSLGTTSFTGLYNVYSASGAVDLTVGRATQAQGVVGIKILGGSSGVDWHIYQAGTADTLSFTTGSSTPITLLGTYVGVNNPSPARELDVVGNIRAVTGEVVASNVTYDTAAVMGPSANGPYIQGKDYAQAVTDVLLLNPLGGNVGINTVDPSSFPLQVAGHTGPDAGFTYDLGSYAKKWKSLYASEVNAETLVAPSVMSTIGGRILIGTTTTLTADITSGATTLYTKHNNIATGDTLVIESVSGGTPGIEYLLVTSGPSGGGPYQYGVTRNVDGSGVNAWTAGTAVFNTGQAGIGFIDLYSATGLKAGTEVGPAIVGNVRASSTYNDWTPRFAFGNLNGIYGYNTDTYGAAFGVPTGTWLKIDPTNGLRIGNASTTKISVNSSGDASFTGAVTSTSGTVGGWTINATNLLSGTGATTASMDSGGTNPVFYAGSATPASAPFRVTNAGALTSTSGAIGGWTVGATSLTSGSGATTVGIDNGGTNPAFYAGSATPASAPFRVTQAGAATITSGTLSGLTVATSKIYAGAGNFFNADTPFYVDSLTGTSKFSLGDQLSWDGATLTVVGEIAVGVTWGSVSAKPTELTDGRIPIAINASGALLNAVAAPVSAAGLYLGSDKVGYYNGSAWKTYVSSAGDFAFGDTGANVNPGLIWSQAGGTLSVKGSVTLTSGSSGYANLSDKPSNLSGINSTEGTKLSGIATGATVGATWGTNLSSIPSMLTAPAGAGLYVASTNMGYYNGSAWKSYIDSSGNVVFGDTGGGNPGLSWNQGSSILTIKGAITATSGTLGGVTVGTSKLYVGVGTYGNANTQFYVDSTGQFSLGDKLTWTGTALSVNGNITLGASSSGYANLTDKPTNLSGINSTEGTKLSGIATGATVGAAWGTNLTGIPGTLATPSTAGVYLASTNVGYYNGSLWKTYVDSSGNLVCGDTGGGNQGISWAQAGGTLSVKGTVNAIAGSVSGITVAATKMYVGVGTYGNANTQHYADSSGQVSLGDKFTWNGTALSASGTFTVSAGSVAGITVNNGAFYYGTGTYGNANTQIYMDNAGKFSLGAGLTWSGSALALGTVTGNINATGEITAYYSDERLKENITPITNSLDILAGIKGIYFNANDVAATFGYTNKKEQVGVLAQDVQKVLPQIVVDAPIGNGYLTVQYEKLVPVLIEAIKELKLEIEELKKKLS